jgi:hypothetical protein
MVQQRKFVRQFRVAPEIWERFLSHVERTGTTRTEMFSILVDRLDRDEIRLNGQAAQFLSQVRECHPHLTDDEIVVGALNLFEMYTRKGERNDADQIGTH